jgi:hypothetical protein
LEEGLQLKHIHADTLNKKQVQAVIKQKSECTVRYNRTVRRKTLAREGLCRKIPYKLTS